MTFIEKNGMVYSVKDKGTVIEEILVCPVISQEKKRLADKYVIQTLKFDFELGKQIIINETIERVSKDILLDELKNEYLPQIKDADLLGDIEEKQRLQQEYLQKKTEIEALQDKNAN